MLLAHCNKMKLNFGTVLGGLLALSLAGAALAQAETIVSAAAKPGAAWHDYPTRTLADLPPVPSLDPATDLSPYGGWRAHQAKATGFFYPAKIDGRWWLVDPEGYWFLNVGVASFKTIPTPGAKAALKARFGDPAGWARDSVGLLRTNGFNGFGAWSEEAGLRGTDVHFPNTKLLGFMAAYGKKRGGTHILPGHLGYPNDCIFVFDPEFAPFCEAYAQTVITNQADPWLLGYFSDNEMPFPPGALNNYLALPETDPGHLAAAQFLAGRHGAGAGTNTITADNRHAFLGMLAGRYFRIVSHAIKQRDPHHLYLGCRFYAVDINKPELFRACGPYVDVVSMNYYRAWTPDAAMMRGWERASGRPILITEWYAKGEDSGMPNTSGAGWLVKTQRERGLFYQNFTLALVQSQVCVGWHWFRYSDNDPEDKSVDPSNRDSNKGIVNNRYAPYTDLLAQMQPLNQRVYSLVDYFDHRAGRPAAPATATKQP